MSMAVGFVRMLESPWVEKDLFDTYSALTQESPTDETLELMRIYLLMLTGRGAIQEFMEMGDCILKGARETATRSERWRFVQLWSSVLELPHTQSLMMLYRDRRDNPPDHAR